jgi:hypothetical protein
VERAVILGAAAQPGTDSPQIRARLTAEMVAERRNRAASPRFYLDGCASGGRS